MTRRYNGSRIKNFAAVNAILSAAPYIEAPIPSTS